MRVFDSYKLGRLLALALGSFIIIGYDGSGMRSGSPLRIALFGLFPSLVQASGVQVQSWNGKLAIGSLFQLLGLSAIKEQSQS